jgi:hypothetical protein
MLLTSITKREENQHLSGNKKEIPIGGLNILET